MGYEAALDKAWQDLVSLSPDKRLSASFLGDEYSLDLESRRILSLSCNIAAKEFYAILILHYLYRKLQGLLAPSGQWLTFRELSGVEGYAQAFRRRCIEPLIRKYGDNPKAIFAAAEKFAAVRAAGPEPAVTFEAFELVPVLIKIWGKDSEFSADANIYFDAGITRIFCTEDIVVLAGIIASKL